MVRLRPWLIGREDPWILGWIVEDAKEAGVSVGTVLAGRYELREALGSGAIGRVFSAWDRDTRQAVTLKLFDVAEPPAEAFTRYAAATRKARAAVHQAIVLPRGPVSASSPRFVVTDALKGSTLEAIRAQDGAVLWPRAAEIVAACAEALAGLHKAIGLAHRALKPSNVWLTDASEVRVLDFGIAELGLHAVPARGSGLYVEYRAPEQLEGAPGDPRSDVFTLGVLLFEMATGVHPFSGPNAFKAAHKVITQTGAALAADLAGAPLPKQAQRFIQKALARRAEERFAGPAEFLYSLTVVRQAAGVSIPRVPKKRPSTPAEEPPQPAPDPVLHSTTVIRVPLPRAQAESAAVQQADKPGEPVESGEPAAAEQSTPPAPQEDGPPLHGAGSEAPAAAPRPNPPPAQSGPMPSLAPLEAEQATCVFVAPASRDRTEILGRPPADLTERLAAAGEHVDSTLILFEPPKPRRAEVVEATIWDRRHPVDTTLMLLEANEPTERHEARLPEPRGARRMPQSTLIVFNLLLVSLILASLIALIMS